MKRYLQEHRFELDAIEKENLWHQVKNGAPAPGPSSPGRTSFGPALGLATAAAAIVIAGLWLSAPEGGAPPTVRRAQQPTVATADSGRGGVGVQLVAGPETEPVAAPVPVPPASVRGRVVDRESGAALANASIRVGGSDRSLITDSQGRFRLDGIDPDLRLALESRFLGYAVADTTVRLEPGRVTEVELAMEPVIVAQLEAFDVEAAEYMVEIKSPYTEHTVSSETFKKFAIESVEDALSKQAGIVSRAGEAHVRGGRTVQAAPDDESAPVYDTLMSIDTAMMAPGAGSVTGGTTPPNGEAAELMYFEHAGVNPFIATEDDSLSTFAVDVDNASYTMARRYLEGGHLPPKDAIRVEEFINFFAAGYERVTDREFGIHVDGAPSRFGKGYQLVRVGLQGMDIQAEDRKAANLIFLIDISGSMSGGNRLGQVQSSLRLLLDELQEGDRVGIIVYGSHAETRLPLTGIENKDRIRAAIDALRTGGSTNAYAGLEMAYAMAREGYEAPKINRIILCSDGVANMGGSTRAEEMLEQIRRASDKGISLSTIGFGMGNYNDVLMEKLADQGDGNYHYVDGPEESERVFRENLTGLMQTIARQVKVQVAFEGKAIKRWRLLGYENRDVADRDFRNDDVDAGEVGAGHQVTALYELKLDEGNPDAPLGLVQVRYEMPTHHAQAGQVHEIHKELKRDQLAPEFSQAGARYRLQAVAAEFAEILRGSFWARDHTCADLVPVADAVAAELADDESAAELARLIRKAADLEEKQH